MGAFNPQKIKNRLQNMPIAEFPAVEKNKQDADNIAANPTDTKIIRARLSDMLDFQDHPFSRGTEEKMQELADSIGQNGLISPPIVRPAKQESGKYEILAGHRRRDACQMIGLDEIEAVFRDVDDDTAALIMVSSNLEQRDKIFPVEKGYAYKMMLEALNRQGRRSDLTCSQVGNKLKNKKSSDELAETVGESKNQIFRYIRLTELIKPLQERVNANQLGFTPAVELSYLSKGEQEAVESTIVSEGLSVSGSMTQKLKNLSQDGKLSENGRVNEELILYVMAEKKEPPVKEIKIPNARFRDLLPDSLKEQPLTEKESNAILEEAMALFREKYESQLAQPPDEPVEEEAEDENEYAM